MIIIIKSINIYVWYNDGWDNKDMKCEKKKKKLKNDGVCNVYTVCVYI